MHEMSGPVVGSSGTDRLAARWPNVVEAAFLGAPARVLWDGRVQRAVRRVRAPDGEVTEDVVASSWICVAEFPGSTPAKLPVGEGAASRPRLTVTLDDGGPSSADGDGGPTSGRRDQRRLVVVGGEERIIWEGSAEVAHGAGEWRTLPTTLSVSALGEGRSLSIVVGARGVPVPSTLTLRLTAIDPYLEGRREWLSRWREQG